MKRRLLEAGNEKIPVYRQCELFGLARSSYYYKASGESGYNEILMILIDEVYTKHPFLGARKIAEYLETLMGHAVNKKRVSRLMRVMCIAAVYPKKRLSAPDDKAKKYPYLLRGLKIETPDHVWCTDITYIRMRSGFVYLVAVMDWYSRYVIAWRLSIFIDAQFCVEALVAAFEQGRPQIFNSDQGSQFTSDAFTGELKERGVAISMDGRGRAFDNIFIERLWRSVKYEEVYLKDYADVREAERELSNYFNYYNDERHHQGLGYRTPGEVYFSRTENAI